MKHIKYIALLFLLNIFQSCKKFVDVDPPIDKLSSEIVFKDPETANSAVRGIYASMMKTYPDITSGGITLYTGLSSDELYNANKSSLTLSEFTSNALSASNSVVGYDFWYKGYKIIYHTNACIEGLENNSLIEPSLRDQLLGETVFIRAFMYYYLVSIYGDVPLLLKTEYEENAKAPRTEAATIYAQIIADVKLAQSLLTTSYYTNGSVRPNKWTATALLARLYLTIGQWEFAEQEASSIINSGMYTIEADLNNVFLSSSKEAIWQLMPVATGFNTTEGRTFIPASWSSGPPDFPLTDYLLNSFEGNDLRKVSWVASKIAIGNTYSYPYKYKINGYGLPVTEYYMIFRLAEQYLIRAECYARQGKFDEAKNDINIIRERAGLLGTVAITLEEILNVIMHERRIELFAEWGHRWFDLKRTGKSTEVLSLIKPDWQATDTLYPIPLGDIHQNPFLEQNHGY
jgi:hypothetical protein